MADQTAETVTQQNQGTITKQKNPLRIEQGRKLNEQITKQDNMAEHKPKPNTNTYVYAGGLSMLGLAIGGYLLYNKFKKQERKLIDVPAPPVAKLTLNQKEIFLRCIKNFYHIIYKWLKII